MNTKTTSEIEDSIEENKAKFYDENEDWTPFAELFMTQKWITIKSLLEEMQKIINAEKKRCGEANAVGCWMQLKQKLEQESKR